MESLVGYGSDDDNEYERHGSYQAAEGRRGASAPSRRDREDDTNYDDVTMDMSEQDSGAESDAELPPVERDPVPPRSTTTSRGDRHHSENNPQPLLQHYGKRNHDKHSSPEYGEEHQDSPEQSRGSKRDYHERNDHSDRKKRRDRSRSDRNERTERSERPDRSDRMERTDRPDHGGRNKGGDRGDRERRSPRKDDRSSRSERSTRGDSSHQGLLGDRPEKNTHAPSSNKVPALMDLKPFGGEPPPSALSLVRSSDARDAVSPRFVDRDRRERDKDAERDREKHSRRTDDRSGKQRSERSSKSRERRSKSRDQSKSRRSPHDRVERDDRSRSRGAPTHPPPDVRPMSAAPERHGLAGTQGPDYRPSYKVSKKLQVMEKMGLQIKTPDGSMATAQQLLQRSAAEHGAPSGPMPSYYNPQVPSSKILDQVQKRKLLWANKNKQEAEEAAKDAGKWTGTRFAQDTDGRQASKFMRLMGVKEPAAVVASPPDTSADPIKKQEELFQAMQAQYDVARVTTHTMRGVGLGFQRQY